MSYRFHLVCPKCSKTTEHVQSRRVPQPALSCGDCLMDHIEVVEFKVVKVEEASPSYATNRDLTVKTLYETIEVPKGAAVIKVPKLSGTAGDGFAVKDPAKYGANSHDAKHRYYVVPDDAVSQV